MLPATSDQGASMHSAHVGVGLRAIGAHQYWAAAANEGAGGGATCGASRVCALMGWRRRSASGARAWAGVRGGGGAARVGIGRRAIGAGGRVQALSDMQWGAPRMQACAWPVLALASGLSALVSPCAHVSVGSKRAISPPAARAAHDHWPCCRCVLWGEDLGYRLWQAPVWVRSQQAAELYGLYEAVKLAAYKNLRGLGVVADNLATLTQVTHMRAKAPLRAQQRIVQREQHTLRWSGVVPRLY